MLAASPTAETLVNGVRACVRERMKSSRELWARTVCISAASPHVALDCRTQVLNHQAIVHSMRSTTACNNCSPSTNDYAFLQYSFGFLKKSGFKSNMLNNGYALFENDFWARAARRKSWGTVFGCWIWRCRQLMRL
eukprot:1241271-Amphidinium_carterae.1